MRRWRERICAHADLIVTPSAAILPPGTPPAKGRSSSNGAPTPTAFTPGRRRPCRSAGRRAWSRSSPGPFAAGTARCISSRASASSASAAGATSAAVFIGDGPELPRCATRPRGLDSVRVHRRRAARHGCRRALAAARHRRRAVRRRRPRPLALGFYWSPLKIFEYMAPGLPVVAPAVDRIPDARRARSRRAALRPGAAGGAGRQRSNSWRTRRSRRQLGAAARRTRRARVQLAAHCEALGAHASRHGCGTPADR